MRPPSRPRSSRSATVTLAGQSAGSPATMRVGPISGPVGDNHGAASTVASAWVTPSPISPAPTTSTRSPASAPWRWRAARATAPWESEVIPLRSRFPSGPACRSRPHGGTVRRAPARRLLGHRPFPGSTDLIQNLGLAQHRRVQPGGHREEVVGHVVVEADVRCSAKESTGLPLIVARNSCSSATPSWKRSTTA